MIFLPVFTHVGSAEHQLFSPHTHFVVHSYTRELPAIATVLWLPYFIVFSGAVGGLLSCYKGALCHSPDCDPGEPNQQSFDQILPNLQASVALGN